MWIKRSSITYWYTFAKFFKRFSFSNYNYQELSRISSDVAANLNYWDGRCLAVAENIGSRALRCRAVISIAKRAHPPWVQQLRDTVDLMMNDANVDSSL